MSVNNKGLGSVASGLAPDVEDNVAGTRRSFVVKDNVADHSEIGLHGASKVLGGCSTSLN